MTTAMDNISTTTITDSELSEADSDDDVLRLLRSPRLTLSDLITTGTTIDENLPADIRSMTVKEAQVRGRNWFLQRMTEELREEREEAADAIRTWLTKPTITDFFFPDKAVGNLKDKEGRVMLSDNKVVTSSYPSSALSSTTFSVVDIDGLLRGAAKGERWEEKTVSLIDLSNNNLMDGDIRYIVEATKKIQKYWSDDFTLKLSNNNIVSVTSLEKLLLLNCRVDVATTPVVTVRNSAKFQELLDKYVDKLCFFTHGAFFGDGWKLLVKSDQLTKVKSTHEVYFKWQRNKRKAFNKEMSELMTKGVTETIQTARNSFALSPQHAELLRSRNITLDDLANMNKEDLTTQGFPSQVAWRLLKMTLSPDLQTVMRNAAIRKVEPMLILRDNGISSSEDLKELAQSDLEDLGITKWYARKIIDACQEK